MTTPNEPRQPILVVDDEPRILTSIQDLLDEDFVVKVCSDAQRALEQLREHDVAVILSDQRMPGMTGDQFLSRARQISRATRVLITGYTDVDALVNAINRGQIHAYVAKPWEPAALKATVASAAEYYRLQVELEHERDLLHALMDNIPDRIYFKDLESRYIRINHAQTRFLGLPNAIQALGRANFNHLPRDFAAQTWEEDRCLLATGQPVVDKVERVGFHQEPRWYSTTKVAIRDPRGVIAGLVGVSRDITERKVAEQALARQAEQLARYNAELEQFAYVSAHDLQEPLRTVASFSQLLAQRYRGRLDADADKYIDLIVGGATRMRQLIHDLLDYSQFAWRQAEFSAVRCEEAFQSSLDNLRTAMEESRAQVTSDPLPEVHGDPRAIQQLFQNLVGNALKFHGPQPPQVRVTVERRDDDWLFAVRDNGIGIEPQFLERIFTVFQRLHPKEKYPGTGIGLAICKRIIERHHGKIWVESTPGQGSTFYFSLPAAATV
jgi:PAS domain S-box-containing protein